MIYKKVMVCSIADRDFLQSFLGVPRNNGICGWVFDDSVDPLSIVGDVGVHARIDFVGALLPKRDEAR